MSDNILATALQLLDAGYSVIPIKNDGSKAPAVATWKQYMTAAPAREEVHAWFAPERSPFGLGAVTGYGGHEMTEVEGRAAHRLPELAALAVDTGLGDLWQRVASGWSEMSPSGGIHFHYRITDADVPGNTKLARRPATPDELAADPRDKVKVLAETRGAGGQTVIAPTPGSMHETGKPWVRLAGGPATAAVLTIAERNAFHALLRTLDEQPDQPTGQTAPVAPHDPTAGITPGDDYENRTDWADILTPHGWTLVSQRGRTRYWLRPGKQRGQGISATTGHADDRDRLYVFTSSTDFTPEVPYTKLGAYALLEHDGDHAAAARELYGRGYGRRAEQARETRATHDDLTGLIAPTNGTPSWTSAPSAATSTSSSPASADTTTATTSPGTPESASSASQASAPAAPGASSVSEPTTYSETDDGNALRLVDAHAGHIRYVPQRAAWIVWDGARWRWDDAGHVIELARTIARNLPVTDKEARRHRRTSMSKRGIEAMVALARSDHRTATNLATLDAEPYQLNTPAGVINLRTGELTNPTPTHLHTRSTTVAPDFTAPCPRWEAFLADTFAGDPALTEYIHRLLGVSLVGTVLEQLLPFAHGVGANGKTTLAGTVQRIIGVGDSGYSLNAPAELLLATRNQAHPTEIARLAGARIVFTSELEDGQAFAEAKVKMLTGKDMISGRFMGKDWFSFSPTHSLWLLANHQPAVRSGGPAFWRRVRMLAFEHIVPEDRRIPDLEDRLVEEEGPAILAWLVRGAAAYFRDGLPTPDGVRAATDAYQRETDTVARFVEDRCEIGNPNAQHMHVKVAVVRAAYEAWCRGEDETPVTAKTLTQQLAARFGVRSDRSASTRFYSGMRLNDLSLEGDDPSQPDDDPWVQDAFGSRS